MPRPALASHLAGAIAAFATVCVAPLTASPIVPAAANRGLVNLAGQSRQIAVSTSGRYVAFTSDSDLLFPPGGDSDADRDVYRWDRQTGEVLLVSHAAGSSTAGGDLTSHRPQISADGRYVAYSSDARNLVTGFTSSAGSSHLFLWDAQTGTNHLVDHLPGAATTAAGTSPDSFVLASGSPVVVFESLAADLVTGHSGSVRDLFRYDLPTEQVSLISRQAGSTVLGGNGESAFPDVSADGSVIAFSSSATDLVAGITDSNGGTDVYVHRVASGATQLVSHSSVSATTAANAAARFPDLSEDGTRIAFVSVATDVAPPASPGIGHGQVYLHQVATGSNSLISEAASGSAYGDGDSASPRLDADGSVLFFQSRARNLVAPALPTAPSRPQLYSVDVATGTTVLLTHAPGSPTVASEAEIRDVVLSADGSLAVLHTDAELLITGLAGSTGSRGSAVLWRRQDDSFSLLSHAATSASALLDAGVDEVVLAAGGSVAGFVTQDSAAGQLGVDLNRASDGYVVDLTSGDVSVVAPSPRRFDRTGYGSSFPSRRGWTSSALSDDGNWLVFGSEALGLEPTIDSMDLRQVFLLDLRSGEIALVSHVPGMPTTAGDGNSSGPILSGDGNWVLYSSDASNLVPGQAGATSSNLFLWDRQNGTTSLVTHLPSQSSFGSGGTHLHPTISENGDRLAFASSSTTLDSASDANGTYDVFLYDRSAGTVERISNEPSSGAAGNGRSWRPLLSADGSQLLFDTEATNLVSGLSDSNGGSDIARYAPTGGTLDILSRSTSGSSTANAPSTLGDVSTAGEWVSFTSAATDLASGITANAEDDCYLHQISTGSRTLVSHAEGTATDEGNDASACIGMSPDGRFVAIESLATDLVSGSDSNDAADVFLFDRTAGTSSLVSHAVSTPTATCDGESTGAAVVTNGSVVVFRSECSNLITAQGGTTGNLFRAEPQTARGGSPGFQTELVSHFGSAETTGVGDHFMAADLWTASASGEIVAYLSQPAALPGHRSDVEVFVHGADLDADLRVDVVAQASSVEIGAGTATFDVTVTNDGAGWAAGVEVLLRAPDTTMSVSASGWAWAQHGLGASFLLPLLESGASRTFTVAFPSLTTPGTVDLEAWVLHSGLDPLASNDDDSASIMVQDTIPPTNPAITSTSHQISTWSTSRIVALQWPAGADSGSGLAGYSTTVDASPTTTPDGTIDHAAETGTISWSTSALADGDSHWFHLRTCDLAGNCAPAIHLGPFQIDATAPVPPVFGPSSHENPSNDTTVDISWATVVDPTSGLAGYDLEFTQNLASPPCGPAINLTLAETSATSPVLAEGIWYAHLCAQDAAGNWSTPAADGPFFVELQPPRVLRIDGTPTVGSAGLVDGAVSRWGFSQLDVVFDEPMGLGNGNRGGGPLDPASFLLVAPGADGVFQSSGCTPSAADVHFPVQSALLDFTDLGASLSLSPTDDTLERGKYRLTACDTLTDQAGNALDGDRDGMPGGHHSVDFTVESTNLLANPNLDRNAQHWTATAPLGVTVDWSDQDVYSSFDSGSLTVDGSSASNVLVSQCVARAITAPAYRVQSRVRIGGFEPAEPGARLQVELFSDASCQGPTPLQTSSTGTLSGTSPGGAWEELGGRWEPSSTGSSVRFSLVVEPGPGASLEVHADHFLFAEDPGLFEDGFESGNTSAWSP